MQHEISPIDGATATLIDFFIVEKLCKSTFPITHIHVKVENNRNMTFGEKGSQHFFGFEKLEKQQSAKRWEIASFDKVNGSNLTYIKSELVLPD